MTLSPIDLLTGRDADLRWVASFRLRGRTYTMRAGVATFADGWAEFSVWNEAGRPRRVKVREADRVEVLTRFAGDLEIPEASE